jgi:hypothetical protein
MPPKRSKQGLYLNPTELDLLYGLPHVAQLLYLAIRRQMNYDDGLVGTRYPISWLELSQALWVEPHQGRKLTGRPEKAALRKSALLLVAQGLITMKSDVKAKRLIFKCELATADDSTGPKNNYCLDEGMGLIDPNAEIKALKQQVSQLLANSNSKTKAQKSQKSPDEQDHQTAKRLFEIKQKHAQGGCRKPNLKDWAIGVRLLKEKVLMPNRDENEGEHPITDLEIEQAFIYAFCVNHFWTDKGIITSPKTLLEHLTRTRKPTFRCAFINWLDKGAKLNETHCTNHQLPRSSTKDVVREGFEQLGIHINP